jgi:hypothetical protein
VNTKLRFLLSIAVGSDAGVLILRGLGTEGRDGVSALPGDDEEPVNLFASRRKGDIDRAKAFTELDLDLDSLGGVARDPPEVEAAGVLFEIERLVLLEFASLIGGGGLKTFFTFSISWSVRAILSRRLFHLCDASAWRRKVSPFLVTRSWTPLSMTARTLVQAGT